MSRPCRFARCAALAVGWLVFLPPGHSAAAPLEELASQDMLPEVQRLNELAAARLSVDFRQHGVVPSAQWIKRRFPTQRDPAGHFRMQISPGNALLTPAVAAGRVFVGNGFTGSEFHCIQIPSGRTLWSVALSDPGPSTPSLSPGCLLINTESCSMYALDPASGRIEWAAWLGDPMLAAPAMVGQCAVTCYPLALGKLPGGPRLTHALACVDLKSGRLVWRRFIDGELISAPVVDGEHVYVATRAGSLFCIRGRDGAIRLARRCRITSAPVLVEGDPSFTRRADSQVDDVPKECIARIEHSTGKRRYAAEACDAPYLLPPGTPQQHRYSPGSDDREASGPRELPAVAHGAAPAAVRPTPESGPTGRLAGAAQQEYSGARLLHHAGKLYNCMGRKLRCVDAATGELTWDLDLPDAPRDQPPGAPPVVAGGVLFVATYSGLLLSLDPDDGTTLASYQVGAPVVSQPVVWNGYVLLGTRNGQLVGINTGRKELTGWSQWGGTPLRNGAPAPQPQERGRGS